MQSIRELYKIGNGPSSSHTMGPALACKMFMNTYPKADDFEVILYGSLALTGKGHLTDQIIERTMKPKSVKIIFNYKEKELKHPNTMDLIAFEGDTRLGVWRVYSVGGGSIEIDGKENLIPEDIYPYTKLKDIKEYCARKEIRYCDYVYKFEDATCKEYLKLIWKAMKNAIAEGFSMEGVLPGPLKVQRQAKTLLDEAGTRPELRQNGLISAYAYAVAESNATGGIIVTAPTCGASGVVPSVLYFMQRKFGYTDDEIVDALATAGLFGNLIKENASISGAECGCQAEIGSACSMAAAAYAQLRGLSLDKIEDAAEIAMENHLGLTCDPIYGYVQIPCIQRNAIAAIRAVDVVDLVEILSGKQKVSFDMVIDTMYETGKDLQSHYKETSTGGLAKKYCKNKFYNEDMEEISDAV